MTSPGIVLAITGLHFAVSRLELSEKEHISAPTPKTKADVIRNGCEALFWLFSLSEDFKNLITTNTSFSIIEWWSTQGTSGKKMNALRLIRNRVTHRHEYYWNTWDLGTLTWGDITPPTEQELNGPSGKYVGQQYSDYIDFIKGESISVPLKTLADIIRDESLKYDLRDW